MPLQMDHSAGKLIYEEISGDLSSECCCQTNITCNACEPALPMYMTATILGDYTGVWTDGLGSLSGTHRIRHVDGEPEWFDGCQWEWAEGAPYYWWRINLMWDFYYSNAWGIRMDNGPHLVPSPPYYPFYNYFSYYMGPSEPCNPFTTYTFDFSDTGEPHELGCEGITVKLGR